MKKPRLAQEYANDINTPRAHELAYIIGRTTDSAQAKVWWDELLALA